MKTFKEFMNEAKQVGIIYHSTSFINAINIINNDRLFVGKTGVISFTRDKNFLSHPNFSVEVGVMFVIDGDKLSNNYKITPYSYHNLDVKVYDEQEERAFKPVEKFDKYIKEIILYKGYFPNENRDRREYMILSRYLDDVSFEAYINYLKTRTERKISIK